MENACICWHSPEPESSPNCSELTHEHEEEDEQWDFDDDHRGANCSRILATLFTGLDTNYRGALGLK
jgi:hypothetical protein